MDALHELEGCVSFECLDFRNVRAGNKCPGPGAGQNHDPCGSIRSRCPESPFKAADDIHVKGIQLVLIVDGDHANAICSSAVHKVGSHIVSSPLGRYFRKG